MTVDKTHYSCAELAAFKLAGFPGTERGWRKKVDRDAYVYIEEPSRGRNGVTKRYAPPAPVLKQIREQERIKAGGSVVVESQPCGPEWRITLSVTLPLSDAVALTAWLEKRRARRG